MPSCLGRARPIYVFGEIDFAPARDAIVWRDEGMHVVRQVPCPLEPSSLSRTLHLQSLVRFDANGRLRATHASTFAGGIRTLTDGDERGPEIVFSLSAARVGALADLRKRKRSALKRVGRTMVRLLGCCALLHRLGFRKPTIALTEAASDALLPAVLQACHALSSGEHFRLVPAVTEAAPVAQPIQNAVKRALRHVHGAGTVHFQVPIRNDNEHLIERFSLLWARKAELEHLAGVLPRALSDRRRLLAQNRAAIDSVEHLLEAVG